MMYGVDSDGVVFIVLTVLLFMCLGVAILMVIDSKTKIPGHFSKDPFSITGLRRDHPGIAFLTTTILMAIIATLLFEVFVMTGEHFGMFAEKEQPKLLQMLKEQRVTEKNRHFHNEPVEDVVNRGNKAVCFYCHGDYPHSKVRMVRTLLNMHTQFLGCMTCHTDSRKIDEESYSFDWLNFSGVEVTGARFGTDVDPKTGYLQQTDDYYSKIVAYSTSAEGKILLEIPEDDPKAREFLAIRDQLSDGDREAIKKSFHKNVSPKGRFCSRCHTNEKESYLPFRKLGFSDKRISDVTNLNIIGIVQKYKKFYLPNLFSKDISLPNIEILVGPDTNNDNGKEATEDPKAWWRRTFDAPKKKQ